MNELKTVKLKEVLKQYRNTHWIEDKNYKQVTISQTGEVSYRGTKHGSQIGRKRQFIIDLKNHPNTLIFIRQGVFNGGIGICPKEVDGCIVTENMPMFDVVNINSEYLLQYLKSPQFKETVNLLVPMGTAQKAIHERQLLEIEIPLPPLSKQKLIAQKINHFLSNKKELSTLNNQNDSYITKLRQQILQEAVQGKLVPQDPNDEPASELLKKIQKEKEQLIKEGKIKKQKPLAPISEDEIPYELSKCWEWCRLGEITNFGTSEKAESNNINQNTWVLDLEDIEKDSSRLLQKIRFKERKSLSTKSIFYKNDVLYGKLRPYLDKVIVADEGGVCTTEILPVRAHFYLSPNYLRLCLKSPNFISYVNSKVYGMKMPRLGTEDGRLALISLPPLPEQHRIVAKVDKLMAYCDELEKQVKENQENSEKLMEAVLKESFESGR